MSFIFRARDARNMSVQKFDDRFLIPRLHTCPIYAYRAISASTHIRSGNDSLCVPLGNVTILSGLLSFTSSPDLAGKSASPDSSALSAKRRSWATFHRACIWLGGTTWSTSPLSISIGSESGKRATFDSEFQRCVHRNDMWRSIGIPLTMSGIDVKVFSTMRADTCVVSLWMSKLKMNVR